METYMEINVDIHEVEQGTQIANQAWRLIHR